MSDTLHTVALIAVMALDVYKRQEFQLPIAAVLFLLLPITTESLNFMRYHFRYLFCFYYTI